MTIELTRTTALTGNRPAELLRGLAGGGVHLPGDVTYDAARLAWNAAVDQRPAAVAVPHTAAEVSTIVRAARAAGLRIAPQSTGHNAGPLAARGLDDVVVVRTSGLNRVCVDASRGIVRVEGGTLWEPAVEAAADHGLTVLHGSSPDVGIAGYSLGGGIGWYARKLGLATNSLTAVELVIGDGSLVRADATTNGELFWAVRGGGGNFGVVTALEFRAYDFATAYAGWLVWDIAHAETVLREWAAWGPTAPDEVTTSFRILRMPEIPELPVEVRGREVVMVNGAVLGSDEYAAQAIGHLRALRPEVDTFARVDTRSLIRLHLDPEGPTPAVSDSSMIASLPDAGVEAFLDAVGPDSSSSLLIAELRHLGGALGRPHVGAGVVSHLDADFVSLGVALAATPEMAELGHRDARRLSAALAPYANDRQYLNFAENAVDPRSGYREAAWHQLRRIRSTVDPDGLFVANHAVPLLDEAEQ